MRRILLLHKIDMSNFVYVMLAVGALFFVFMFYRNKKSSREYFGGKIKNMKRIPKTTCWKLCDQYYVDCMSKYGGLDAGYCQTRQSSCVNVCNHQDFMVM